MLQPQVGVDLAPLLTALIQMGKKQVQLVARGQKNIKGNILQSTLVHTHHSGKGGIAFHDDTVPRQGDITDRGKIIQVSIAVS